MDTIIEANQDKTQVNGINRIAVIGNYIPKRCGIATFTTDLCRAMAGEYPDKSIIALPITDIEEGYKYPGEVRFEMNEKELDSYRRGADFLNINNVDMVLLQHEFGIFGGPAGSHILELLKDLSMPLVTTLHTVLPEPEKYQKRVLDDLMELSQRVVVMSEKGKNFLEEIFRVPEEKIDIIPHGIHDVTFEDPNFHKDRFGVEGKNVILTFGLLAPDKGIENMIQALPKIVEKHPDTVYVILGVTHPQVKKRHGEKYRFYLEQLASQHHVEDNVSFFNRFVSNRELMQFIGAADIYVTPYNKKEQITSGTLAYTVGAGKAVVSTPYWHAEELLDEERGVLI
ncbi:MAG: glycosyltransferase family 4 protein, partial [Vulcanimicrobiota bacterium]